jgi:hypothetical protein
MCLFRKPKKTGGGFIPGAPQTVDTDTTLPTPTALDRPEETTDVTYGGKGIKEALGQKAQGARSLAINLQPKQTGAGTGGLNIGQGP